MYRRILAVLLWLVLVVGLMTPVLTLAETPPVPVVLIHGQGGSPDLTWRTAIAHLQERGYRLGETLFAVDLSETKALNRPMGLLDDTGVVLAEVHRILGRTGAAQVDLVGHSRGGLIVRLLATGDTSALVRRAVTLNTPHEGALSTEQIKGMLATSGVTIKRPSEVAVPPDLQAGSQAMQAVAARTARFGDRTVPVLAIASTWREDMPAELKGHDGAVTVKSQLAWPGARTALFRLGPTEEELQTILRSGSELAAGLLVLKSPHLQSLDSPEVLGQVAEFLLAKKVPAPLRPCDPGCQDWSSLTGHPAAAAVKPALESLVPYELGPRGQRVFEPDRPMTRAEFTFGLVRALGLEERFRAPSLPDLSGHWAGPAVEAAREARLVGAGTAFYPDDPMTRGEAVRLIARAKGLADPGVRGDEPLTMADGALLLIRAFSQR
ncbi:MAG TPA: alpha/beta fold hydrolase [Symbiobacteriaceae bacterium]|nr:alpha/beta fold hydrolase [Symbiobacteriaceae bacterium]